MSIRKSMNHVGLSKVKKLKITIPVDFFVEYQYEEDKKKKLLKAIQSHAKDLPYQSTVACNEGVYTISRRVKGKRA